MGKSSVKQVYRPDSVRQASLAGNHSSGCAIADALWPSTRILGRAALRGVSHTYAYLMLLRAEVTAFHPTTP